MATTMARPLMAWLAILIALLAQLLPALAQDDDARWTVTEYRALSLSLEPVRETCTTDGCRFITFTRTVSVSPDFTPTAEPISARTESYSAVVLVTIYVEADDLPSTALITTTPTTTHNFNEITQFVISTTYTAPASCPTPFTLETIATVDVPVFARDHVTGTSTSTFVTSYTGASTTRRYTTVFHFIDPDIIPTRIESSTLWEYSFYVSNCRNPTATPTPGSGPNSGSGPPGSIGSGGDDDDDGYYGGLCNVRGWCREEVRAWVIAVAVVLPTIFLFGFVESYFWFRRMMLGKSALRLGTVCWCALSLWVIFITRKSPARSEQDQALLKNYWATLSAGTRIKLWFKWGFRWAYPVELLGNPDGNNPVVAMPMPDATNGAAPTGTQPPPAPGYFATPPPGGDGEGKPGVQVDAQQQQQGFPMQMYMMPVQPGQQPYMMQPYPPQGFMPQQQGYMMPMPPQSGYVPVQPGAPPMAPGDGAPPPPPQQQPMWPGQTPSPPPVQTNTTGSEAPPVQQTPPPTGEQQQQQQPQQPR
ncbi:hypothetical protein VTK26DRAFT_1084 [Humicola hyalothermophila]